jgi:hypothetical protein
MAIGLDVWRLQVDRLAPAGQLFGIYVADGQGVGSILPCNLNPGDAVYMDILSGQILYIKDVQGIIKYDWGQVKEDSP